MLYHMIGVVLSVNQQADNKVKVVLFGAGKNVEEFIQEVKDIL